MLKWRRITGLILCLLLVISLAACGGDETGENGTSSGGTQKIVFCTYGDDSELAVYKAMVDQFNETYGKEHNIYVEHTPIAITGYTSYITSMSTAQESYDVFLVIEDNFKRWVWRI